MTTPGWTRPWLWAAHRTNVRGTFVVAQQAARKVRAGGAIITFSTSVLGEDIAEVVAFLASPAGHWINGQVIRANGGII